MSFRGGKVVIRLPNFFTEVIDIEVLRVSQYLCNSLLGNRLWRWSSI